ncbi:MAG: MarR family transcriptional regulator [Actinobacteria bacterium]|nr:MarR family transcriptional regulator [Actinomycetota bacterium]
MKDAPSKPRRRRTPTAQELRIWRDYIEATEAIRGELATRLQHDSDLSAGDYRVLLALAEADRHRMRSSALATQIGWQRSRLSHHLGRMERRGLIRRQECPSDSRGAEVVLAGPGREAFDRSTAPHLRAIREVFLDALTPAQLAAAGELAAALRAHQEERRGSPS